MRIIKDVIMKNKQYKIRQIVLIASILLIFVLLSGCFSSNVKYTRVKKTKQWFKLSIVSQTCPTYARTSPMKRKHYLRQRNWARKAK